jgi:hypothetical protein
MRATVNIGNHQSQLNVNIVTSNGINAEICIKTPFTKDFEILSPFMAYSMLISSRIGVSSNIFPLNVLADHS